MAYYGVKVTETATSVAQATVSAESGIVAAFGTAPVHQVGGKVNVPVLVETYDQAVAAFGYSDDWETYSLCEVIYSHFKLYGVGPLVLVNVLDPDTHKESVASETAAVSDGQVAITEDAIESTIVVKNGDDTMTKGTDYDVLYTGGNCVIEFIGSTIPTSVTVSYDKIKVTASDMKTAVIGGTDASTGKATGLELMDSIYFITGVTPDLLIAPGFSDDATVAAVMAAKTTYSTVFKCHALVDLDTTTSTDYIKAQTAKEAAAYSEEKEIVCWPMVSYGDRVFHLSTQLAGAMVEVDQDNNGVPSRVASNHELQADGAILSDGTEVNIDITAANALRAKGIVTALNFVNGFTAWGAYTALGSSATDVKDKYISVSRMFGYVTNHIIKEFWASVDQNMTRNLATAIANSLNIWLSSLVSNGDLIGARCEVRSDENSVTDMMAGIVRVHVYMTPPTQMQEIDFILEYDSSYVEEALA